MNLTIRLLGCEVFAISTEDDEPTPGDATTYPVGFTQDTPLLTDGRYGMDDHHQSSARDRRGER